MRIIITEIKEEQVEYSWVIFCSSIGNALARWVGSPPTKGKEFEVEIDIPEVLYWNFGIMESQRNIASIREVNNKICLHGQLMSIDDDNIASVQIDDNIILVEVQNCPIGFPVNVKIIVDLIELYDSNI